MTQANVETGERTTPATGTVVAVCSKAERGVPKIPQAVVTVGEFGIEGDFHSGLMRTRSSGEVLPNNRHISIVAKEVFDDLNRELGTEIPEGGFGENILVEGMGNLSELKEGDMMRFSSGVELEITGQNDPCKNLMSTTRRS